MAESPSPFLLSVLSAGDRLERRNAEWDRAPSCRWCTARIRRADCCQHDPAHWVDAAGFLLCLSPIRSHDPERTDHGK